MEPAMDFRYIDLKDVDPSFTLLDPDVYDFRITKVEIAEYQSKKETKTLAVGDTGTYVKFALTVVDHPKFTGRKLWPSLFPSDFSFKILRRIADAVGIQQTGSLEDWCKEVSSVQPAVRLTVDKIPDVYRDGTPNPKTVKPDGTPNDKNEVNWRAGVGVSNA